MGPWIELLLPFMLLLGRVTAFFAALPLFGWRSLPMRIRAGIALLMTIFFAQVLPRPEVACGQVHWLTAALLLAQEVLCGLALGLAARLAFHAVEQGGRFASRQMGFALAGVVDPNTGMEGQPLSLFFEITFSLFFLAAGGHHLLIALLARSYEAFPVGQGPEIGEMVAALVAAGSAMLTFALRMAAPLLAACLVLTVVLGVLARALPEMNVLLMSFPLRIGLGLLMAATMMPYMNAFTARLGDWMNHLIAP
jgi:flagellar biosynthetic protein FliR